MVSHVIFDASTPLTLAKAGNSCRCESPGGAASVLPSRSFGFVMPVSLRVQMLSGVLSNTAPTSTAATAAAKRFMAPSSRGVGPGRPAACGEAHRSVEQQADDGDPHERGEGDRGVEIRLRVHDDHAEARLRGDELADDGADDGG